MLRRGRPGAAVDLTSIHAVAVEADAAIYAAAKAAFILTSPRRAIQAES